MKRLTQIFQALLGVVALIFTAIIAFGRLTWRKIRNWWKNRSKWLRRSIAAIFIIVPVGFVALVAYALYEDEYGRDYWDRKLSDIFKILFLFYMLTPLHFFFFFFFFFFFCLFVFCCCRCCYFLGHSCGIWRFPGYGFSQSCSRQPTPEPQQCGIRAASATYTTALSHVRSLTH